MEISYAWEGLGKGALPAIRERELMSSDNPDVAYAAARAAAWLGDVAGQQALVHIARTSGHKFQVNAVRVLGTMPSSPSINESIRPLLDSSESLVRLEAYRMLSKNGDNAVFSTPVHGGPEKGGFTLDVVHCDGPPVIYATQRGEPRIAVIGNKIGVNMPITFATLEHRLSVSSNEDARTVTIFYRPPMPEGGPRTREQRDALVPVAVRSNPDIAEVIARLGGEGADADRQRVSGHLDFNYGEVLSILSLLTQNRQVGAYAPGGAHVPASFILQELPRVQDQIDNAPPIPEQGRPQKDEEPTTQQQDNGNRVGLAK
jgi:hypothetical protein